MHAVVVSAHELALQSFLKARERLELVKSIAVVATEKYHDLFLPDESDPYDLADAEYDMNRAWEYYTNELRKFALEETYARKIGVIE